MNPVDGYGKIQAFEMKCFSGTAPYLLQGTEYKRIYSQSGHHPGRYPETSASTGLVRGVARHDSLLMTVLQGWLDGGRRRGKQQKKWWLTNIKEWTGRQLGDLLNGTEHIHDVQTRCTSSYPPDDWSQLSGGRQRELCTLPDKSDTHHRREGRRVE